jgi:hypothetical protein
MSKSKYIGEFELKASARMLFPYINTASGLAEWFADNVNFDPKKNFIFIWNGEQSFAKKANPKPFWVKYEFLSKEGKEEKDPSCIEFRINENEMTGTSFMEIIDYSEFDDHEEMQEIYESLVNKLKEIVGG